MLSKDYAQFDLADLVADEDFVSWVIAPDQEKDAYWNELAHKNPGMAKVITEARLTVLLMESRKLTMTETRNERLWRSIQDATIENRNARRTSRFNLAVVWKVAAVLLVTLLALGGIFYMNTLSQIDTVATRKGEKRVIHLEDGTEVWLNAASKLTYPKSFDEGEARVVELDGEAFFEVAKNPEKPFIVTVAAVQVKVLGTAFNVRSFHSDEVITTLVHGKVQLEGTKSDREPVILSPGQQAMYSSRSGHFTVQDVKVEDFAGWKDGRLHFDNALFAEIEAELERWYGIEILYDESANKSCRFSTTLDNEPIAQLLEMLKASSGIEYSIDGKTISIKGTLCSQESE